MIRTGLASSALPLVLVLSACGGGGGGGGGSSPQPISAVPPPAVPTPAPTPTPTPAPAPAPAPTSSAFGTSGPYNTAEYQNSNAAVLANALAAYDKGATGAGVKLSVIDSGINPALPEFAGRIDPASADVVGTRGVSDEDGHGTAVSAVAAAAKNGTYIHGVAFDAAIVSIRADRIGSCADTEGCQFDDSAIAAGVRIATDAGAKVINLSLGGSQPGTFLMNAFAYAVGKGVVLVISAGNDGAKPEGVNADPFGAIPAARFPGSVIIAGSVGTFDRDLKTLSGTDQISPFSNRAGTSAAFYLTALGAGVRTLDETGGRFFYSGTSFSAPTITGAVALLAQAFPNLTGQQIVTILFESADDLGAVGIDEIFGRGRLNIARAFQPAGTTALAGTTTVVSNATGTAPASAGDAAKGQSLGAIVLDGFSRAYAVDLARSIRSAPQAQPLGNALAGNSRVSNSVAGPVSIALTVTARNDLRQGFAVERTGIGPEDFRKARLVAGSMVAKINPRTAVALGFKEGAKAMERRLTGAGAGSFLIARDVAGEVGFTADRGTAMAIRRDFGPVGVTVSGEQGEVRQGLSTVLGQQTLPYRWTSIALDRRFGRTWLSTAFSRLDEKRTLLGGTLVDALGGGGSAETRFVDLEARRSFGNGFSIGLNARQGWTRFTGGAFRSGAYGVDFAKAALLSDGDRFGLRVSQPLRIENGGLNLYLPTGYSYDSQSPTMSWSRYSLSPRGREIDAELSYQRPLSNGAGWIGGNVFARRQPGHFADADADVGAAVRFSRGF